MDKSISELFEISEQSEKQLWEYATIVFDSSALLNFYNIPKGSRLEMYKTFRGPLNNRLMLPGQVQFEYLKNRKKTIHEPIEGNNKNVTYFTIENNYFSKINSEHKRIKNAIEEIKKHTEEMKNATHKPDRHPHLEGNSFSDFNLSLKKFEKNFENFNNQSAEFKKEVSSQVKNIKKEIMDLENNDDVLDAVNSLFILGKDNPFSERMKLAKEAEERYAQSIPPGYKDNLKPGLQKFGDFYVWNQILDYAKENKKSIIFICDDITKEDWCIQNKTKKGRIAYPQPELSMEFLEKTSYRFWMYSLSQWPYYSNKYLKTELDEKNFKFENEEIDQSLVNPKDIAIKIMKILEKRNFEGNIPPIYIDAIFNHLEELSFESVLKLKKFLTNNLSRLQEEKLVLRAKIDFSENVHDKSKFQEELNDLEPDINDYEQLIMNLDYQMSNIDFIPF